MWYYRPPTTTSTTPAPPTSVWDYNGKDISPNVISFVVFIVGIILLIYALHCCKKGCQGYINMDTSSRDLSHASCRSEVVLNVPVERARHAPPILPVFTVLINTPTHYSIAPPTRYSMEAPPPSYEKATNIIDEPPKYEDCVR